MSNNSTKYEVLIKQYLRSILDISGNMSTSMQKKNNHVTPSSEFKLDLILSCVCLFSGG